MELRRLCVLLLLKLSFVSSEDVLQSSCVPLVNVSCESRRLVAPRGSSLLLPCDFGTRPKHVSWTHLLEVTVVTMTSTGHVNFLEPRSGRIKTFPNQGSRGNFSIAINPVMTSDLGCYHCRHDEACVQVELVLPAESRAAVFPLHLLVLSAVGLCALAAVGLGACFCLKRKNDTEENSAIVEHQEADHGEHWRTSSSGLFRETAPVLNPTASDVSVPTQEHSRAAGDSHTEPPASPAYENAIIYENEAGRAAAAHQRDTHNPQGLSHTTKLKFHSELMARLRQASLRRHHYVNQHELQMEAKGKTRSKEKTCHQFKNPIYSHGASHQA